MAIIFDKDKGFIIDEVDTVRDEVRKFWIKAFAKPNEPDLSVDPSTPQGQLIDSQTASIMNKDSELLYLANQFNPASAEGIFQDALANIYFLQRQPASPTTVICECIGLQNTIINKGSIIKTTDNIKLVATDNFMIDETGKVSATFQATKTGAITIAKNTANIIVTQIPGWDSVNNPTAGVIGRNEESAKEFADRIKRSVAINAQGSVQALRSALSNVAGVVSCEIGENDTDEEVTFSGITIPAHSIGISIFGGDNSEIAKTIFLKKDMGCGTTGNTNVEYTSDKGVVYKYKIVRPTPYPIGIQVIINFNESLAGDIEDRIKKAVLSNFNGEDGSPPVRQGETLYATRFIPSVIEVGVNSLKSVKISVLGSFYDSIDLNLTQMPTLDISNIQVVIEGQII